ncbi:TPA: hypothetical protein ACNVDX_003117 [Citrobacter gillenii]
MAFFGAFKKKPAVTFGTHDRDVSSPKMTLDQNFSIRVRHLFELNQSYSTENFNLLQDILSSLYSNDALMQHGGETYNNLAIRQSEHSDFSISFNNDLMRDLPSNLSQQQYSAIQQNLLSRIELLSNTAMSLNQEIKGFRKALSWMS